MLPNRAPKKTINPQKTEKTPVPAKNPQPQPTKEYVVKAIDAFGVETEILKLTPFNIIELGNGLPIEIKGRTYFNTLNNDGGLCLPGLTQEAIDSMCFPDNGLVVFNHTTKKIQVFIDSAWFIVPLMKING